MEQWELDAYKQLSDLYSVVNNSQLQKTPITAPGEGSRTQMSQDAIGWGVENLSKYLLENNGDPLGVLDSAAVKAFLDPINARRNELATRDPYLNYGTETEPSQVFSQFTLPQLQAYLDRQRSDWMAAGNPGNDAMWLPTLQGDRVVYGQRNSGNGGILDAITGAVEPALALSGFAGPALGASIAGSAAIPESGLTNALTSPSSIAQNIGGALAGGGETIPELGLIANPETAAAAINAGIPASTLAGGAGAIGAGAAGLGAAANALGNTVNPDIIEEAGNFTGGTGSAAGTGLPVPGAAGASSLVNWLSQATGLSPAALQAMGILGAAGLNWVGQNNYSDALTNIANQARSDRQPFLNKSLEWMNNPSSYMEGVGKPALDATLRALSVQGNPFGSPTSLAIAGDIANRNWQNAVTGFGNIGLSGEDSRNTLLAGSANADRGALAGVGSAFGQLTSPNSLEDILRRYQFPGVSLP